MKLQSWNPNNSSVRDRLATLLASLLQAGDDTVAILPLPEHPSLPQLNSPTNIPVDSVQLNQYLTTEKPTHQGTKQHLFLSPTLPIHQLKSHPTVASYLRSSNTWIKYNMLRSTDITALGWMFCINPDAYSRQELYNHMIEKLDNKFTAFQLNSCNITYNQDSQLLTRAWVLVEMDEQNPKTWFPTFLEAFPIGGNAPNLVPFSAAHYTSDNSIKKVFYLHNKSLSDSTLI